MKEGFNEQMIERMSAWT